MSSTEPDQAAQQTDRTLAETGERAEREDYHTTVLDANPDVAQWRLPREDLIEFTTHYMVVASEYRMTRRFVDLYQQLSATLPERVRVADTPDTAVPRVGFRMPDGGFTSVEEPRAEWPDEWYSETDDIFQPADESPEGVGAVPSRLFTFRRHWFQSPVHGHDDLKRELDRITGEDVTVDYAF